MPVINVRSLADALGGPTVVNATISATMYGFVDDRQTPAIRIAGENITFPAAVTVELVAGEPVVDLALDRAPAGFWWKIVASSVTDGRRGALKIDVLLPGGSGPFDFDDLLIIDPNTMNLVEQPPAAWWVALEDLQAQVEAGGATPEQLAEAIEDYFVTHPSGIEFAFPTPLGTWSITHSLGRRPNVTLFDPTGIELEADVISSSTQVVVTWALPTDGSAVLS